MWTTFYKHNCLYGNLKYHIFEVKAKSTLLNLKTQNRWMDDLQCFVLYNSISAMRMMGRSDYDRLCAMEPNLH